MLQIRPETAADQQAIHQLNTLAFDHGPEAQVVDALREACHDYVSFVAVEEDMVVGHILLTPATIDNSSQTGMGLAPLAVLPSHQGQGIGSQLVRHGIDHVRQAGYPFLLVLGYPDYYSRFGFVPASRYGLTCQWADVPDEAFMVMVFDETAMPRAGGTARYRSEFDQAM